MSDTTTGDAASAAPPKPSVFVAIVTHPGTVKPETGAAIQRSCEALLAAGHEIRIDKWVGDSLIADARNGVLTRFLESNMAMMVFLDHDIAWDGDEFERLVNQPVEIDLVAGVYRLKKHDTEFALMWLPDRKELWADPTTGLLEVAGAPTGFMRMTRRGVEWITMTYGDRRYRHVVVGSAVCVFDCGLNDGLYWGEDFLFCRRWREAGGKVWVDPELHLHHIGHKDANNPGDGPFAYSGKLGDWLRSRIPEPVLEAAE